MGSYQPKQSDIDELPVQKKRILSLIPSNKWTDPVDVCHALARLEGVHLTVADVIKSCRFMSRQGLVSVSKRGKETFVKSTAIKKEVKKVQTPEAPPVKEPERRFDSNVRSITDAIKEDKTVPSTDKETINLLVTRLVMVNDQVVTLQQTVFDITKDAVEMLQELQNGNLNDEEMIRLMEVEEKYNQLKDLLK